MGLTNPENEVFDGNIDLSETRKKRFRINGDNKLVLELNTSDMNTIVRLRDDYPKLMKLANKVLNLKNKVEGETEQEELTRMGNTIESIDAEMRDLVDHIFDSKVCQVCAIDGSMYDLFNGKFRFEHIIEKLSDLYGNNMKEEFKAVNARVKKHTAKYTKK